MEKYLTAGHSSADIERIIQQIHYQLATIGLSPDDDMKFGYGKILVFSQSIDDVVLSIQYLRELEKTWPDGFTDYWYYQIIGPAQKGEYSEALIYCDKILNVAENNNGVKQLKDFIEKKANISFNNWITILERATNALDRVNNILEYSINLVTEIRSFVNNIINLWRNFNGNL